MGLNRNLLVFCKKLNAIVAVVSHQECTHAHFLILEYSAYERHAMRLQMAGQLVEVVRTPTITPPLKNPGGGISTSNGLVFSLATPT